MWRADEKAVRRVIQRLGHFERESRMLRKRSEEYEVLEEVFDKPTLLTLYDLMNTHIFSYLNGVVKAGKESRVYWGVRDDGSSVAVKIFLTLAAEFRKRMPYIVGDPRFSRVNKSPSNIIQLWARKEYSNLLTSFKAGIPVPCPHAVKKNILIMDFVGQDGVSAPLLSEVNVTRSDYKRVIQTMGWLYRKAKLVHADLSEFNIFKEGGRLTFFDFGSAVDITHPSSKTFITRDASNINRFFAKRGIQVESVDWVLRRVVGSEL